MIKNEKQYAITKTKRSDFLKSLVALDNSEDNDLLKKVMKDALQSQIETFNLEIEEYEKLKCHNPSVILTTINCLPESLIKIRIISGLSQADLAQRNGMHEQQIQRYEANNYSSANFERVIGIAQSMDVSFEKTKILLRQKLIEVQGYNADFIRQATNKLQSKRSLISI